MPQSRVYDLDVSITAAAQPDPGVSSASPDIVVYGTPVEQEVPAGLRNGANKVFTFAHTPRADWPFAFFMDGVKYIPTTEYTRVGAVVTLAAGTDAPAADQVPTGDYRY